MKRFKIPETGDNVILKSKKTTDYKEVKIVEVEAEFYAIELATGKSLKGIFHCGLKNIICLFSKQHLFLRNLKMIL